MMRHRANTALLLALSTMAAACQPAAPSPPAEPRPAAEAAPPVVGMANPASVACVRSGGDSRTQTDADGSQIGYCHFPDGRVCEEWALFRDGRCVAPPANTPAHQP